MYARLADNLLNGTEGIFFVRIPCPEAHKHLVSKLRKTSVQNDDGHIHLLIV